MRSKFSLCLSSNWPTLVKTLIFNMFSKTASDTYRSTCQRQNCANSCKGLHTYNTDQMLLFFCIWAEYIRISCTKRCGGGKLLPADRFTPRALKLSDMSSCAAQSFQFQLLVSSQRHLGFEPLLARAKLILAPCYTCQFCQPLADVFTELEVGTIILQTVQQTPWLLYVTGHRLCRREEECALLQTINRPWTAWNEDWQIETFMWESKCSNIIFAHLLKLFTNAD